MLKTKVYIKSVTNLTDARYCAGMGVDYVGFCIDITSPNFVSESKFNEIKNWLVGVKLVAEIESLKNTDRLMLDSFLAFGFHALLTTDPSDIEVIQSMGFEAILLGKSTTAADYFISGDTQKDSSNQFWEVKSITDFEKFSLESVAGICIESTDEIRPGYKNMDNLIDILEFIEE